MSTLHAIKLLPVVLALPLALGAVEVASPSRALADPPAAKPATPPPAPPTPAAANAPPAIDPKAMDLLKQSVAKLKELPVFSVHADATQDVVVRDGFKVQKDMTENVLVQKPNHMRAEVNGDNGQRIFVYDGKSVTVFTGPENYYGTVAAAPTLAATLDTVNSRYDLDLPLTDILYMAVGETMGQNITEAGVIGTSRVAGAECDHLAFRTKAVDWQVWIERNALLPRKLVVTTRGGTDPQYEATLTWNTAPAIAEGTFAFTPPPGALPMRIRNLDESAAVIAKPPGNKAKAAPK